MIGIRSEGKVAEVDQLIDNMNAGETDAFLAAFAPDGYVDDNGAASTGRDEIRVWSDRELIGANTKMEITGPESTADTVAVDITEGCTH